MGYAITAITLEGDTFDYVQDFTRFLNEQLKPETNLAWRDELDQRFESLACDYAEPRKAQVDFYEKDGKTTVVFNFSGQRFTRSLQDIVEG